MEYLLGISLVLLVVSLYVLEVTMNNNLNQDNITITIADLQNNYEALYREHLSLGGQTTLDKLLAFQRVLRFYMDEEQFDTYMRSL